MNKICVGLGKNSIFPFLNFVSRVQLYSQHVEQYLNKYCPINKYFISQFNVDNKYSVLSHVLYKLW